MPRKTWMQRYMAADTLYTARECGCLVVVMVDMPDVVKADRDLIVRESLAGRTLQQCGRGELPPLYCVDHDKKLVLAP